MPTRRAIAFGCAMLAAFATGCSRPSAKVSPPTTVAHVVTTTSGDTTTSTPVSAPTTTATPSTTSPPATTTTEPADAGIAALMLADAPGGYDRQDDSLAATGPTGLAKAAQDDALISSPAVARQVLVEDGFVQGYQRQWQDAGGIDENFVFLYEFVTPQGAQAYVEHWRETIEASAGLTASRAPLTTFSPLYIPGGIGLSGRDRTGSSAVVLFAKGVFAVQALAAGVPEDDFTGPASALALAQYALLP